MGFSGTIRILNLHTKKLITDFKRSKLFNRKIYLDFTQ